MLREFGKVVSGAVGVVLFFSEIQFLRQGDVHLGGEPFEVVFGEEALESREGESCQGEVEGSPLADARVLHFDSHLYAVLLDSCRVYLSQRCRADGLVRE